MSLSNTRSGKWTGKVIVGVGSGDRASETTIQALEGKRAPKWDDEEYMERVRARAAAKAQEILVAAQAEAAQLREQAREEGYAEGIRQAQAELDQAKGEYGGAVGQVLEMLQSSGRGVFERYRQDLVILVRMAAEKVIGTEISWRREDILGCLLDQALEQLDSRVGLNITVNPADEPLLAEMLEAARQRHAGLDRWRVKPDAAMQPGGVVVESDHGMVDNTLEGRMTILADIFSQLSLPVDGEEAPPDAASPEPSDSQPSAQPGDAPAPEPQADPAAAPEASDTSEAPEAPEAGPGMLEIPTELLHQAMGLGMTPEFVQQAAMQGIPPHSLVEAVAAGIPPEEAVQLIAEAFAGQSGVSPDPLDAPDIPDPE